VGRTALTQQKRIAAEYLEENYQKFFSHYTRQLDSANYATKRQFLKLLSDILLDR
jgi:calcium binding protein 39